MATKLARQMAYKKKLEEEFRLAEERKRFERKSRYSGYEGCVYETWHGGDAVRGRKQNNDVDFSVAEKKENEIENQLKESEKKKKAEYEEEKQEWMKKREIYIARAAKFSELKKMRFEGKARIEKSKKFILEEEDIWEAFDSIIKDNERALKDLEDYKITVENKEKEEKEKFELERELRIKLEEPSKDLEKETPKTDSDLSEIEKRIRELELSIASLDDELERFEIEKMNSKTSEVKERMSIVSGSDENNAATVLNSENVDAFIKDNQIWNKYMISTN